MRLARVTGGCGPQTPEAELRGGADAGTVVRHSRRVFLHDLTRRGAALVGAGLLAGCAPALVPTGPRAPRPHRVGVLGPAGDYRAFWQRMEELGYVEGQNLVKVERLAAGDPEQFNAQYVALSAELVRMPVDVIRTRTPGAVRAAMNATTSIPIVMGLVMGGGDPVTQGFVESLARPGRNVTGVAGAPGGDLVGKRLELLVEAAPGASTVVDLRRR